MIDNLENFHADKADKLKRLRSLRIMNALGMVAWQVDRYGCASQKLRILHPFSWPWVVAVILAAVVLHGVVEVCKELKQTLAGDCVWW